MLSPSELPGIRRLASEVFAGLSEGSLVSVSVPCGPAGTRWLAWFMEAIYRLAREHGEPLPMEGSVLPGSAKDPLAEVASIAGVGRLHNLDELLEYYPDDGVLVVVIECEQCLGGQWKNFFDAVRRACRAADSRMLRPVLAIIVGSREFPPITHDVGSKVFALWNTVRWEELRLLADAVLPQGENSLIRAWRMATYTGAANGDPEVLIRLCRESPDYLDRVVALGFDETCPKIEFDLGIRTMPERRWDIPQTAIEPWAVGNLLGYTVERGPVLTTNGMTRESGSRYLRAAIWREQITGLFPVTVELGFNAAAAITSVMGVRWQQAIPPGRKISDDDFRLDPKEVMEIFATGRFGRVPQSIWSFLDLLRRTRNDLAHMSPVDLQRMRQIWQGHDLISRRFGKA